MNSLTSMASILILMASSVFFGVGCMTEATESADVDEQGITDETTEAVEETSADEENTGESQDALCGCGGYNGLIGVGFGYAPFATCCCVDVAVGVGPGLGVGQVGPGLGVGQAGPGPGYGQAGYGDPGFGGYPGFGAGCP